MDQPTTAKAEVKKVDPAPQPAPVIVRDTVVEKPAPSVAKEAPLTVKEAPRQASSQPIQNFNSISEVQSIASTSKQS
jgi:hypothetical protein